MAVLIPRKQIEEQKDFTSSLDIGGTLTVSGSFILSQSFFLGSLLDAKNEITGAVELTGSLRVDGDLILPPSTVQSFTASQALSASNALQSFDTTRYAGILARDFGANVPTLYVSATDGDDNNDGRTIQFPLKTIKRAAQLATPGFDGRYGLPSGSLFSGYVIRVQGGSYIEDNPVILPKNSTIWGSGLRITKILAKNPEQDLFWVNSGCYVAEVTVGGLRLWPNQINPERGFGFAFQPGAFITTSPYIQNCSQISNQENSFTELYEDIPPGGGGLYVNGDVVNPDSPLASMVLDAYTQISPNGVGCLVNGRGFIQLVSFFNNFSYYAIRVNNGGHATLNNSNISFGLYGMYASGSRKIDAISGGNEDARKRVRASYSVIIDVLNKGLEKGLPTITTLNTDEGIKVTAVTQSYTTLDTTEAEVGIVKEDFRIVSEIVKNGIDNYPALLAKSSNKGYDINNPYNILGATQFTSSISASAADLNSISSSFATIVSILNDGTGSYTFASNNSASIKVNDIAVIPPISAASNTIKSFVSESFENIIKIISGNPVPNITSSASASLILNGLSQYRTGLVSSGSTVSSLSSSFSIIYNVLDNGTGSSILPIPNNHQTLFDVTRSGSNEAYYFDGIGANPTITLFRGLTYKFYVSASLGKDTNPFFIRTKPVSGFATQYDYNAGVVNNGDDFGNITFTVPYNAPNELYYISQNSAQMVGKFNIVNSSTTPFDLIASTVTYPKLVTPSSASTDASILNAYDVLQNNKNFIKEETITFLSSSWSDFSYNSTTFKQDIGYIVDAVSNDLLYGGNSQSISLGLNYIYPNYSVGTQKDLTLTAIKFVSGIAQNLIKDIEFRDVSSNSFLLNFKDVSDTLLANREFFQKETISYLSSSWSTFDYNELSCSRDIGYIIDAVATDVLYGGNERSITAGTFYLKYPSEATSSQLVQTIDGIRFTLGNVLTIIEDNHSQTFVTASLSTQTAYNLLKQNKQLIQNETIQFINTTYPTLEYNEVSCSRDVGYIVDAVATDLLYGGNERSVKAGRFYYDVPSIATTRQKTQTIAGVKYTKVLSDYIVQNIILETPRLVKNIERGIKVSALNSVTSSFSGTSVESNKVTQRFNIIQDIIRKGTLSIPAAIAKNTDLNWDISNPLNVSTSSQQTSSFELPTELETLSKNWDVVTSIIEGGIVATPTFTSSFENLIKVTNGVQITGSFVSASVTSSISSSFSTIINVLENGLTSLPTLQLNTIGNVKATGENIVASTPATTAESSSISSSFALIADVLKNGLSALPTLTQNTAGNIKVGVTAQFTSASFGNATARDFLSSSFSIVTNILETGDLDLYEKEEYTTRSTDVQIVASYNLLKENIDFIQTETIAYLSSSWRDFSYNEDKCKRDIGYIVSGAAEDLIYGVNRQSIINGQFYYEFPSEATGSQLIQTLDGINYASRLAQKVILSQTYNSPTANKTNAAGLLVSNKNFIKEETISYISSSWSTLQYSEQKCRRDIGYILDAVATDLIYGGNERSRKAAEFYFLYPSQATGSQLHQTIDAINYASRLAQKISVGQSFTPADSSSLEASRLVKENADLIANEVVKYVSSSWSGVSYNEIKCKRDVKYILDAIRTDLVYGGNERTRTASEFYYLYPSAATVAGVPSSTAQLDPTVTGIGYASGITQNIVLSKVLSNPSTNVSEIAQLIRENRSLLQSSSIDYVTFAYPDLVYDKGRCFRDVGFITDGVVTDFVYGGNQRSSTSGYFYYKFPSKATNIQVKETVDTINFAKNLSKVISIEGSSIEKSFTNVINIIKNGRRNIPSVIETTNSGIKATLEIQTITTGSVNSTDLQIASASFANVINIISNGTGSIPTIVKSTFNGIISGSDSQITSSVTISNSDKNKLTDSFNIIYNIIENGTGSLPNIISNADNNVKRTNLTTFTTASLIPVSIISSSNENFDIILDIVQNGTGSIPYIVKNSIELIKVTNGVQYTSSLISSNETVNLLNEKFDIVLDIVENGVGSYVSQIIPYTTPSSDADVVSAYDVLKANIPFIVSESIAYLNSAWSNFVYNQESCSRDIAYIVSGAAEDLLWSSNSSSINNGKYYYDYPSEATVSQLQQTLDGIRYAKNISDRLARKAVFKYPSSKRLDAKELISQNKNFIANEVISYVSASWSDFSYNEISCSRDINYILDAIITDVVYGGNERSVTAGRYYYDYPSEATTTQLGPTLSGISHAKNLTKQVLKNSTFGSPSTSAQASYNLLQGNKQLIQNETIGYLNSAWSFFEYNQASCSRDIGYMIDAVATDILYGGNQSSVRAGEFYYLYPSLAIVEGDGDSAGQLGQTLDGVEFTKGISEKIISNTLLVQPSLSQKESWKLINRNKQFVQKETIAFLSSSWSGDSGFSYNEASCSRDVAYILDAVATDVLYGGNQRSSKAGEYYFLYPSSATVSGSTSPSSSAQLGPTVDGIKFAAGVTNKILQNIELEEASANTLDIVSLLRTNKKLIQDETIEFIDAYYPYLVYNREKCRRDVGFILDAVITDLKYGGNERSIVAGDYYFRYPNKGTTSEQITETLLAIFYSKEFAKKIAQNILVDKPQVGLNTDLAIKVTNTAQVSGTAATQNESNLVSASISIVTNIIEFGSGSYPTASIKPASPLGDTNIVNAYNLLKNNIPFIVSESIAYLSSSWSTFEYNEASCSRDVSLIISGAAEDILYGVDSASIVNGKYYLEYPSAATSSQLIQTLDGINYASRLAQKIVKNITFQTASIHISASVDLLKKNKAFIQAEAIEYVSSSWSQVVYNQLSCSRDVGYLIDAVATDLLYGGEERTVTAADFYYRFPSRAIVAGVPSETNQLDPTLTGIRYAGDVSSKVVVNSTFTSPSQSVLTAKELLISNKGLIQAETIAFLSSSWSTLKYNEVSCSRDVGYIIDGVVTDLVYGGNESSIQAGSYYYKIPSVAIRDSYTDNGEAGQKIQTVDGINFARGVAEKIVAKTQLVFPGTKRLEAAQRLLAAKEELKRRALSYTNGAFPNLVYNEASCSRDTGLIVDALATDIIYGGNERGIAAATSYYTGQYGSAAEVVTNQRLETLETNRYLRTRAEFIAANAPKEDFGSLIVATGIDYSYNGAGVTFKALPPNQGGSGVANPVFEVTELGGGRIFFTSGNQEGDFRIGTGLSINQATGTLVGRTFSKSLFSLVTPFSLALEA